ncbi:hypothetical protein I7I50_00891 [Histoplasma capsulatum G186AR]|uniref:Uncharacterized protein n=1 Tax=Ajellomyces capsulatus TaxID=5037 RepID=A0A8H8CV27_AJECA|nr:hypothetical protein I7I52_08157 [Histoplasma capsulatum]QSS72903.1 hypothetical protein I7I50_00891 [Histoplasma capsulatum G186AR]
MQRPNRCYWQGTAQPVNILCVTYSVDTQTIPIVPSAAAGPPLDPMTVCRIVMTVLPSSRQPIVTNVSNGFF